jgi:hypothetical protein
MTVQELINQLQTLPQDKKVVLSHTDHTDWTYKVELTPDLISEDEFWDEENSNDELDYEDEVQQVVIINCKLWD